MRAGLASPIRIALFLTVAVAFAASYGWFAVRAYRADRAAAVIDQPHLERAMRLEPSNSDYPYRLGMYAFRLQQDAARAEDNFKRAVALNPYMTRYWLGLAAVYVSEGDIEKQKAAVAAAVAAEPNNPATTWEAGNLYLVQNDVPHALHMFRITLQSEQYNDLNVFEACWRATQDVDLLLREAIPEKSVVRLSFLRFLVDHNEAAAAAKVWSTVISGQEPISAHDALPYVDYLLAHHDLSAASRAWQQLTAEDSELRGYTVPGNRVVNEHFDEPLLNSGFDWRIVNNPAVTMNLDSVEFRDRGRSLKLTFNGDPFQDAGISQIVPLEPGKAYGFAAWVKTEEIYSAQGPRFALEDAITGKSLLLTSPLVGTSPWQKIEGTFQTDAATQAVRLRIVQSEPAHIKGSMWVDDLSIAPK